MMNIDIDIDSEILAVFSPCFPHVFSNPQVAHRLRRPCGAGHLGSHPPMGLQRLGLRRVFGLCRCPGLDVSGARGFGVARLGEFSESRCVRSMCPCHFGTRETPCEWSWSYTGEWWYLWRICVGWGYTKVGPPIRNPDLPWPFAARKVGGSLTARACEIPWPVWPMPAPPLASNIPVMAAADDGMSMRAARAAMP